MRKKIIALLISIIIFSLVPSAWAEINTTFSISGGYQGNLFNDSLSVADSYTSFNSSIRYYPSGLIEIAAYGVYNAYASINDLSHIKSGASVTLIPTSDTSPLSLIFSGAVSQRSFGELFDPYDRNIFSGAAAIGYHIRPALMLKSQASYLAVSYVNSDFGSQDGFDISGSINFTPIGSNAFEIDINFAKNSYEQASLGLESPQNRQFLTTENYSTVNYSLRYSRPLGNRTGVNMTFIKRQLDRTNTFAIPGYSIDYLSPWADLWEGSSISATAKHYFPRQISLEIGAIFSMKSYADVMEYSETESNTYQISSRDDNYLSIRFSFSKSITMSPNSILLPALEIGYIHNNSTSDLFDYDSPLVTFSMSARL